MSSSYVGSSSDFISGASSSGVSGGSSALTQQVLGAVSLAGENVLLNNESPGLATPANATPVSSPSTVASLNTSSTMTWIILAIVVLIGFFAVREL